MNERMTEKKERMPLINLKQCLCDLSKMKIRTNFLKCNIEVVLGVLCFG